METIKVNMSPNPLDVQTIHASQNDGEARQWEFELHNNGELIDTSNVTEQLFFKAYKGGTEQLLPENGSTPTTSPFLGDIKYPQGLLTDQEFTYRQSPTEKDGLAKITDIKGNTLVWNQLVNGFPATTEWNGITITNNDGKSITLNGTYTGSSTGNLYVSLNNISADPTHWYLYDFSNVNLENMIIRISSGVNTGSLHGGSTINTVTSAVSGRLDLRIPVGKSFDNVKIVPQMFDLTQMFGAEIAQRMRDMELETFGKGVAYFRSLFSLPYYSYNQGSLLSFNGNGIKTVGFNQWDEEWEIGSLNSSTGEKSADSTVIRSKNFIPVFPNTEYYCKVNGSAQVTNFVYLEYDANKNYLGTQYVIAWSNKKFTTSANAHYIMFRLNSGYGVTYNNDICINISDSERNGTYEPYTSSTLSLPISTYFPTGMKSAGSVYDELTPTKAITRIGAVDLGTLNWSQRLIGTTPIGMQTNGLSATIKNPSTNNDIANIISTAGTASSWTIAMGGNSSSGLMAVSGGYLFIATTETNPTAFKSAMSGVYLYYELATPTETSFTTASLVTENGEIPLSNEDGVLIGKCTEQLSENPGFIDAKIKLSDSDGECYSNKLQLHVERSPQ